MDPIQAFVELNMDVADSLAFEIWTPNEVQQWALGEAVEAVGAGTIVDLEDDDDENHYALTWAGSAEASDTYYVAVENVTDSPVSYYLTISGEDVIF